VHPRGKWQQDMKHPFSSWITEVQTLFLLVQILCSVGIFLPEYKETFKFGKSTRKPLTMRTKMTAKQAKVLKCIWNRCWKRFAERRRVFDALCTFSLWDFFLKKIIYCNLKNLVNPFIDKTLFEALFLILEILNFCPPLK